MAARRDNRRDILRRQANEAAFRRGAVVDHGLSVPGERFGSPRYTGEIASGDREARAATAQDKRSSQTSRSPSAGSATG